MHSCKRCGSYAINDHHHGRERGVDLDLCDVCYWRKRAEDAASKRDAAYLSVADVDQAGDVYANDGEDWFVKHATVIKSARKSSKDS